ncbi:neuropeptide CCHamide-1 [Pararge aegeria]|uniref:neuropeptide CCHamide-1 n=1 Tax=Pararge aegeria TaxID=116150 RepID=UPI0019D19B20|nr:neuropeptide CCHamide-1 [Pararge aegeria]XP_039750597.1 neuropeptide CCHamide-1 [Pararge aegeria]
MQSKANSSAASASVRGALLLMIVVCLVECTTEQRINSRGSKPSNLIQKVNGWRSQRGGSCLSYGHSCWGAHGKRSGKPPASAPDWYITRILRRMAASNDLNRAKQLENQNNQNDDAIYRVEEDSPSSNRFMGDSEEVPIEQSVRGLEAKPMLDDDMISKMKLWQIMKAASEEK